MDNMATDKFDKSMVADNESDKSIPSEVHTSFGMFLQKGQEQNSVSSLRKALRNFTIEQMEKYVVLCRSVLPAQIWTLGQ